MLLRNRADLRTLVWVFVLMPGAAALQYAIPRLAPWLMPVSIYLAYCAGVVAHNHNHAPTFVSRKMNAFMSSWISFFYGYPVFAWIPTHNENHHRYTNREGDATRTTKWFTKNNAWAAFAYFFYSASAQAPAIKNFLAKTRTRNPRVYRTYVAQQVTVAGGHLGAWALAIALHGPKTGTIVYASALGVPSLLALWGLMFTNYLQHVDCEAESDWNHSRNFVSPWLNWLIFDNGFHTVHHEKPGLHWSLTRAEHERVAHLIDPRFNEDSIFSYCFRAYVLGRPFKRFAPIATQAYDNPVTEGAGPLP